MNFEQLKTKPREELVELAGKMGLQVHHKAGVDKIAKDIVEKAFEPVLNKDPMQHPAAAPVKETIHNTPEQVNEAIKDYLAKDGYTAEYPGDNTWVFKYKGAEESGNLSIPLRVIKMKAGNVAKGRRALMSHGRDGTYGNSYVDNILA